MFHAICELFKAIIEKRAAAENDTEDGAEDLVVPDDKFYATLYLFEVRSTIDEDSELTAFLAHKAHEPRMIDIHKLATATGEFIRNNYLKSYGTVKHKLAGDQTEESPASEDEEMEFAEQRPTLSTSILIDDEEEHKAAM